MFANPRRDAPGSIPTDPYRSTGVTPFNELIDPTPTPAQLDARRMTDAHASPRCCYLKPSGERCGSPAMRGFDLCYYHDRYRPRDGYRNLPCLEDAHSVQCAIQEIVEDMLNGLLDYKKAALALYGLQTAASNLKQMRIAAEHKMKTGRTQETPSDFDPCLEAQEALTVPRAPCPGEEVRTAHRGACLESESFEEKSFGEARLQPCRQGEDENRASAPEVRPFTSDHDGLERFDLQPARPTTDDHRPTTPRPTTDDHRPTTPFRSTVHGARSTPVIESPRPPQNVRFGLTAAERQEMDHRFPDMNRIRTEFLASLTPEQRARL